MNLRKNKAFTLIELLVVIAIIGILAALIIVSLSGARERARDTQIKNNVRSMATALESYALDQSTASYPTAAAEVVIASGSTVAGTVGGSACVTLGACLAPYLSGAGIYNNYVAGGTTAQTAYKSDGSDWVAGALLNNANDSSSNVVAGAAGGAVITGAYDNIDTFTDTALKYVVHYGPQ